MNYKYVWLLLVLLCLSACSSAPAKIEYYSLSYDLHNKVVISTEAGQSQQLIVLEPITLADFLRQRGLVVQTSEHKMHMSSQHRWAESLDLALSRTIMGHLENRLPQFRFENQNGRWSEQPEYRLNLSFSHFHTNANSEVVVAGNFWILTRNNQLIRKERFYLARTLEQDGFLHAVESLNQALAELASKIAVKISSS